MSNLTFSEYQAKTSETAIYEKACRIIADGDKETIVGLLKLCYVVLGLVGEAGEIANKVKKVLRDDHGDLSPEKVSELGKEIGDVEWYAGQFAQSVGVDLGDICQKNLDKLASRKERGVLQGSGDNR